MSDDKKKKDKDENIHDTDEPEVQPLDGEEPPPPGETSGPGK